MQSVEPFPAAFTFDPDALFERILIPVEFNDGTQRALAAALELRRRFGSEVHLFHLTESSENDRFLAGTGSDGLSTKTLVEDAEARLRRFVENLFPGQSGEVIVHANVGADVLHGIVRSVKGTGATIVVLGAEPKHHVFRTQVEKLVQELDCSVLLVRPQGAAPAG